MKRKILYVLVSVMLVMALATALTSCDVLSGIIGGTQPETVDLSAVVFADATFTYDGEAHSIVAQGLPEGVTVEYTGNEQVNAGKYTVVAKFYKDGALIEGADKVATLRINKASLSEAMESVSFTGKSFVYDGEAKSIYITGDLPAGVTVSYEGNGQTEVGKYLVTAKFAVDTDNYYAIADKSATLTILEATEELPVVSGVTFADATVVYDGLTHSLAIEGTLPEGITVEYINNDKINAGSYIVEAKFFYGDIELEGQSLRAKLKIEKATADLSGISFAGKTVLYNGEAHSLSIAGTLPDYATVSYVGNGQTTPGSYKVLAVFNLGSNYESVEDMEATLTILGPTAGLSDITLQSLTASYDGEAKSIAISGTLPEGVTVEYEGNEAIEIGTYTVTAKFYYGEEYIEGGDISATIKIVKGEIDMSGVIFESATYLYDGEAKSIAISGTLPEGVTVEYEGNGQIAVGTYTVTAKFSVSDTEHYNAPADMTASLTISFNAASLEGITFEGKTVVYNGMVQRIDISGTLPEGVTVRYIDNAKTNAGTYSAIAKFYYNGEYIEGADLGATLKIEKADADMSGVIFESATFLYDGEAKSIYVTGTLPEGVTVEYEGNGQVGVGSYTVTAKFVSATVNENYNPIADMTATLTIDPNPRDVSAITFEGITVTYDGNEHSVYIAGELNPGVTVEYEGNGVKAIGSHTVTAKFYYNGEYIEGADKTATIVIEHSNPALAELVFDSAEFVADGEAKSIYITGTLPEGYTVEYVGNGQSKGGTYTVTAKFYYNGEYIEGADMIATYTIISKGLPAIIVEDLTVDFDGKEHEIVYVPTEELPEGVSVIRIGSAQYNPGVYTFTFRYSLSAEVEGNYEIGDDVTVTLTINEYDGTYETEGLVYKSVTGGYAVTGYTGDAAVVIIPSTYEGKAVVSIAANAFKNNAAMRSVVIPDSVQAIGQGAFRGTQLVEITVPFIGGSRVTSNPFFGYIFGASGYVANEIYVPVTLTRVVISDSCTIIPAYSFRSCVGIQEIVIGAGVTEIGISAFEKCESLKSIYIPATVTEIPAAAYYYNSPFFGCGDDGFTVYLEAAEVPAEGYGQYWNEYDASSEVTVVLGVSYEEYLSKK